MLIEIRTDLWINSDYVASVSIKSEPQYARMPVCLCMTFNNEFGAPETYWLTLKAWEHMRIQLKLYSRLSRPTQSAADDQDDQDNQQAFIDANEPL